MADTKIGSVFATSPQTRQRRLVSMLRPWPPTRPVASCRMRKLSNGSISWARQTSYPVRPGALLSVVIWTEPSLAQPQAIRI